MAQGPVLPISGELETLGWGHGPGMRGETAGGRLLALNSKAVTLDSDLFQSQPPYIKNKDIWLGCIPGSPRRKLQSPGHTPALASGREHESDYSGEEPQESAENLGGTEHFPGHV